MTYIRSFTSVIALRFTDAYFRKYQYTSFISTSNISNLLIEFASLGPPESFRTCAANDIRYWVTLCFQNDNLNLQSYT